MFRASDVAARPCDCWPGASTSRRSIHGVRLLRARLSTASAHCQLYHRWNESPHMPCPVMPCEALSCLAVVICSSRRRHVSFLPPQRDASPPTHVACPREDVSSIKKTINLTLQMRILEDSTEAMSQADRRGGCVECAGVGLGEVTGLRILCYGDCVFVRGEKWTTSGLCDRRCDCGCGGGW
jgi:hypothetical protein